MSKIGPDHSDMAAAQSGGLAGVELEMQAGAGRGWCVACGWVIVVWLLWSVWVWCWWCHKGPRQGMSVLS